MSPPASESRTSDTSGASLGAPRVGLAFYALGSVVVWVVLVPLTDLVTGDMTSLLRSAGMGVITGVVYGMTMYFLEPWIRRRWDRRHPRSDGSAAKSPPPD